MYLEWPPLRKVTADTRVLCKYDLAKLIQGIWTTQFDQTRGSARLTFDGLECGQLLRQMRNEIQWGV
jgi:hypothetical protein